MSRQQLLHAVLRRWACSAQSADLVLRGGLLTQFWVGVDRRVTRDIDFLGLFTRDPGEGHDRIETILKTPVDDGVSFDLATLRGEVIWQETAFPGLRFLVNALVAEESHDLQIDLGFDDPLVPPAVWIDYPTPEGEPIRVQAVRPELMTAWKLNGLFDHGARRWLAKDLYDLHLLTATCQLEVATLAEAIRIAFEAHADSLAEIPAVVYSPEWWQTESARKRWDKFRAAAGVPVPEDLLSVAASVAEALRPALSLLMTLPK